MSDTPRLLGGRYEVGSLLGRGGMAEVHVGRDTRLGRTVAIKMLRADLARDQQFHKRFRREAQAAASLNHPSIVAVYDSGEDTITESGGAVMPVPYIVMEYVEGRTVRDILALDTHLEWPEALRIASGVLAALEYSHRAGIVHRDIKPANVMLTPSGQVKVMDFGIARAVADSSATMTQTQAVIGTAQYLSPEQAKGQSVDARSDLYSTGCLLFEMLTGRPPFIGDSPVSVAYQHVGENPPVPSSLLAEIPPPVDAIVLHSLAKEREARYQDASGMRADCEAVLAGRPISAEARGAISEAAGLGAVGAGAGAWPYAAGLATEAIPYGEATQAMPAATPGGPPTGYGDNVLGLGTGLGADVSGDPTSAIAPVDPTPPKKNHSGIYVLLGLAVLAALALLLVFGLHVFGSNTPSTKTVPPVTGQSQASATTAITNAGLTPKVVQAPSSTVAKGDVSLQSPTAGTTLAPGGVVTITVSSGPSSVPVPDVSGESKTKATADLKAAGLTVSGTTTQSTATQAANTVVSTSPAAGTTVNTGTPVQLVIASGSATVPNVVGAQSTDASNTLTGDGFKVKQIYTASSDPSGQVVSQDHAGDTLKRGATVTLTISTGQPTGTPSNTATATSTTTAPPTP